MNYPDLDEVTRKWMLVEFQTEINSGKPYLSEWLTSQGKVAYVREMENAIKTGNETTLGIALNNGAYFQSERTTSKGSRKIATGYPLNLARNEFLVWYTHGLARRLKEEGVGECVIYRAGQAIAPRSECTCMEGRTVSVEAVYNGHRDFIQEPKKEPRIVIPSGPNCHHSIKRANQ